MAIYFKNMICSVCVADIIDDIMDDDDTITEFPVPKHFTRSLDKRIRSIKIKIRKIRVRLLRTNVQICRERVFRTIRKTETDKLKDLREAKANLKTELKTQEGHLQFFQLKKLRVGL